MEVQTLFDLNKDRERLARIISDYEVVTLYSSEAMLEDIFLKVTGRRLTA